MDKLRKLHNSAKREMITTLVNKGDIVLDVGCGRGGDLHKWAATGCFLFACDPDIESVNEAQNRGLQYSEWCRIFHGDVLNFSDVICDAICYNFSLQYIFKDNQTLRSSLKSIAEHIKPGGLFFGVVPDANRILTLPEKWTDKLGNTIEHGSFCKNNRKTGNMIIVKMSDGPYYKNGAIPEPLCYNDILINEASEWFELQAWTKMIPETTGLISDIYSKFIFRRV